MSRFEGRAALITGGAQGIGRGIAERLATEGAAVVLLDVEARTLERTARDFQAKGWRVESVTGDVASRADVRRAVELAVERFGRLDALVGVAGITERACSSVLIDDPVGGPAYLQRIPLRRWGEPADIAAVAAFLVSDDAAYMTGEDVTVDAGATVGVVLDVEDVGLGQHGSSRAGGDHGPAGGEGDQGRAGADG